MYKTFSPLAAALLACGVSLATPASAEPTRIVHYGDLDLGSPAGQQALNDRLRQAVRNVCGAPTGRDLREVMSIRRCHEVANEAVGHQAELTIAAYRSANRLAARR